MNSVSRPPTLLVLSQVYIPDPAAVGQHMADAAAEMARRGWRVVVLTSGRGYEDPSVKYPSREVLDGVEVIRLPLSSFGKKSIASRLLGQMLFLVQAFLHGVLVRGLTCVLVSTSPPMASLVALGIRLVRRVPLKFWLMDLNPDQAIALGKVPAGSLPVRAFDRLNRWIWNTAQDVIVLDRYMAQRVGAKPGVRARITVLPPWPHGAAPELIAPERNPFRTRHHLQGKFVFMYSGNMSFASPLTTILKAALRLRDDPRLFFLFVGGGLGKREVEQVIQQHRPGNMLCLPYQPVAELPFSLSAADVHLVTLGDNMVGIIHPCKIYGAMAVARPILFVGPWASHLGDIVREYAIGWQVNHGDVEGTVRIMRQIAATAPDRLQTMGWAARQAVATRYSKAKLCAAFADMIAGPWNNGQPGGKA